MGFFDWFKGPDHAAWLDNAFNNLMHDSPRMRTLWCQVQDGGYSVSLVDADLPGDTLGSTTISDSGAQIRIDVGKVIRKHDCLEAVIAHELFHVNDARFKYSVGIFQQLVERDKHLSWDLREVERSAVAQEDILRRELQQLPPYSNIASSRAGQNARSRRW